jgi:hypothetical protein
MTRLAALVLLGGGLLVGVGALVALHLLPTGLSPMRNAVSQYGISPYRTGYRVQTMGYAAAGLGAAIGISSLPGSAAAAVILCAIFATSRAVISWFPMDMPGTEHTSTGRNHGLLAIAAFASIGLASRQLGVLLKDDHLYPGFAAISAVLALVMGLTLVGMMLVRRAKIDCFGILERGFYVWMTLWLVAVGALIAVA